MAAFKYKFETIKNVKERFEKKVQKELAVIDMELASTKDQLFELSEVLKKHKRKKIEQRIKKIEDFHFDEKYENYLLEQIGILQKMISNLLKKRKLKVSELVQKSKETKTFEKLKENHFNEFIKVQDKLDQKEMDEFAVNEYLKEN